MAVTAHTTVNEDAPVASGSRVRDLDALRGLALLGVVVVNYLFTSYDMTAKKSCPCPDAIVWAIDQALFHNKVFLIFAFLLGYSFVLRASKGGNLKRYVSRRGDALVVIGVLHALFLSQYDILVVYGVVTVVLARARHVSDRFALRAAGVALLAAWVIWVWPVLTGSRSLARSTNPFTLYWVDPSFNPVATVGTMVNNFAAALYTTVVSHGPTVLGVALLGMVAARRGLLTGVSNKARPRMSAWALAGVTVCAPLAVLTSVTYVAGPDWVLLVLDLLEPGTNLIIAATYIAVAIRVFQTRIGTSLAAAIAPAGQMTATNYVTQSLVFMLIFSGYGLGLAGTIGIPWVAGIAIATWSAQLLISRWWLRRHTHGPVEWSLRDRRPTSSNEGMTQT